MTLPYWTGVSRSFVRHDGAISEQDEAFAYHEQQREWETVMTSVALEASQTGSGQILSVTNTGSGPTDVPMKYTAALTGDHAFGIEVSGDTNPRWKVDAGGEVQWGPGNAVTDVDIHRSAEGTLTMSDGTNANNNVILRIAGTSTSNESALFIQNGAQPSTPTGGGILFVHAGALKYIGSSGTVTTLAPA